ncbi:MAG: MFS transporter [Candidatus Omnitrophica bacterium]|nr:MFS transporter [Candidatus Omnitrophota bacterium]
MGRIISSLRNKNFFRLWLAQLISQFGDRINQMALIGLIASRTPGSTMGLAKLLSFTIIPVFIIGPVAGAYVDRWDRRQTLFFCDILRCLLVLTIPLVFIYQQAMLPIYVVVFLVFSLSRFYVPAKMSIIPDLVEEKSLLDANSLVSVTGMIAFVLGCAFGGFLVEKIGVQGGFIWDAATFLISGLLVLSMDYRMDIRLNREEILGAGKKIIGSLQQSLLGDIKEGIVYFFTHKEIRFVNFMLFILFAAAGAVYVVIIVFIQDAFQSVTRHLGFLAVLLGVGLFLGAILYGRFGQKVSRFLTIFVCLILGGAAMVVFALVVNRYPQIYTAGALAFLLGVIIGPIFIAANTIIHLVSKQDMRGRVFSSLEVVMHLGFLIAMFTSAFLSEKLKIPNAHILITVGCLRTNDGQVKL